ncbi:glyoxalase/bleomycin resistance/extradiol dioxygenase family protein [Tabrizicola piscis]|uniref:Glyoxalase/bleomycin resistance/extradiol dioxygenase family protein n=1 Tax=Tabrizicola piscis TaxID=2494374 RepID=A0A3S8U9U6_9RHOB|nr:glyoxalase/bleomycin resistance/extradiol dioxygenase family protein [Tabrizicola piscis]AZL60329.1 glyoxalase/bleomycin resistance/extradiol dioxygenase family protein [Tabrizicola piscis]
MANDIPADQRYCPDDRVMHGVIPYICLAGKSGAAAEFYAKAFGAKDIGRMPMEDRPGKYMHLQLEINGGAFMLTDHTMSSVQPGESPIPHGHLQLVVPDGQVWWDRAVAAGCTIIAPFERQFWGDTWGLLADPFGLRWAVLTPDPALWDKGA